jgi:Yip1 domain
MTGEPEEVGQIEARGGSAGRLIGALISPRPTLESIARKPAWLLPLLLFTAIAFAEIFTYGHQVGWRGLVQRRLESTSSFQQLSPQQQQQAINRTLALVPAITYIDGVAGPAIVMLVLAGIFLASFNIVFGMKMRFKQSFSITAYGLLPQVVKGLLAVLVMWVRPPEGVDLGNVVMSNAAVFLPSGASSWLSLLASSFDLFSFWTMALLAMGYAAADSSGKVKVRNSLAVVVGLWLLFLVIVVGLRAAFS